MLEYYVGILSYYSGVGSCVDLAVERITVRYLEVWPVTGSGEDTPGSCGHGTFPSC